MNINRFSCTKQEQHLHACSSSNSSKKKKKHSDSLSVFFVFHTVSGIPKALLYSFNVSRRRGKIEGGDIDSFEPFSIPILRPVRTFFKPPKIRDDFQERQLMYELLSSSPLQCATLSVSGPSTCLYLLLNTGLQPPRATVAHPEHVIYDTTSKSITFFEPPIQHKPHGPLISAYGMLYYFADPICCQYLPEVSFERYDPSTLSWERLPPCPFYPHERKSLMTLGYAVSAGCILFSLGLDTFCSFILFNIERKEWHSVTLPKEWVMGFEFYGKATVIDGVIYASSIDPAYVHVFKLGIESSVTQNDTISYSYHVDKPVDLYIPDIVHSPYRFVNASHSLVYLGDFQFCLMETGTSYEDPHGQHVCITSFQIVVDKENSMLIKKLDSVIFKIALDYDEGFILHSYTPDYAEIEE